MINESKVFKSENSYLNIEINDSQFYMPRDVISGTIKLNPAFPKDFYRIKLKLVQFEFWNYLGISSIDPNKVCINDLFIKNIEHKLYGPNSNNEISIPFTFEIYDIYGNKKLLPTFQFQNDKYYMGIRHLLVAEYGEHECLNYKGLFIGKCANEEKKLAANKQINNFAINIEICKQCFCFEEEINYKLTLNSSIKSAKRSLYRIIELNNNIADRKEYLNEPPINNDNNSNWNIGKLIPISLRGINLGACGAIFGAYQGINYGNRWYHNMLHNIIFNFVPCIKKDAIYGAIGGLVFGAAEYIYDSFSRNNNNEFKKNLSNEIPSQFIKEEDLVKNLEKFVFFKDKKVIGFIKFENDITPTVNGNLFKCNYYIEVNSINPTIPESCKIEIDIYDGEHYCNNMKNLFRIESKGIEQPQINGPPQINDQMPFYKHPLSNEQSEFKKQSELYNAGQAFNQQSPTYNPPPFYGQPASNGQPPSFYGQPPSFYGQPTSYGQPPPFYGQPASYGQPPSFYGQPPSNGQPPSLYGQLPSYIPPM